jgi:hypothetical protein
VDGDEPDVADLYDAGDYAPATSGWPDGGQVDRLMAWLKIDDQFFSNGKAVRVFTERPGGPRACGSCAPHGQLGQMTDGMISVIPAPHVGRRRRPRGTSRQRRPVRPWTRTVGA